MQKINVQDSEIQIEIVDDNIYLSLTNIIDIKIEQFNPMLQRKPQLIINKWLNQIHTLEYLLVWEKIHNPKVSQAINLETLMKENQNSFPLSLRSWIKITNGIGFIFQPGKIENIFAHVDIVIDFLYLVDPMFQVLLLKAIQNLKSQNKIGVKKNLRWPVDKTNGS